MRESASAGLLAALLASLSSWVSVRPRVFPALGWIEGLGDAPGPAHLPHVSGRHENTRIGQELLMTTAGVAHQPCKDPGGKCLKQCPHSERFSWGGLCPVSTSTSLPHTLHERGIQLGPKSNPVAWNNRVTVAAGSAPPASRAFPESSWTWEGGWRAAPLMQL